VLIERAKIELRVTFVQLLWHCTRRNNAQD